MAKLDILIEPIKHSSNCAVNGLKNGSSSENSKSNCVGVVKKWDITWILIFVV